MSAMNLPADGDPVRLPAADANHVEEQLSGAIAFLFSLRATLGLTEEATSLLENLESARVALRLAAVPVRFTGEGYAAHPGQPHRMDCCK